MAASKDQPRRLVVAITGATGAIYGVRLLQHLSATSEIGSAPGHQGFLELADHPAAVRERRVHRRLGHHERDVRFGRAASSAQWRQVKTNRAGWWSPSPAPPAPSMVCGCSSTCPPHPRSEVRQGIKDFSNWPTIPQLYVNGEFIGGSDIMNEMYDSGELQALLNGGK